MICITSTQNPQPSSQQLVTAAFNTIPKATTCNLSLLMRDLAALILKHVENDVVQLDIKKEYQIWFMS